MEKITKSSDKVLIDPNEPLILPNGTALVGRVEWFLYALCCLDYQNLPTPMSRIEEFANALITGEIPNIQPQSRAEQFFLAILDGNISDLPQPQSRSEVLLDKLARGEFDLSDVEPIQSSYELLLAYLIKNGGIGNIDYVLYEFSEAMKTMYNTVEKPFKSLELSGNTLVNCVLEDTENDDYTSFDKDYSGTSFTINGTSEGAIKSAILKGRTLINLFDINSISNAPNGSGNQNINDWVVFKNNGGASSQTFYYNTIRQDIEIGKKYVAFLYVGENTIGEVTVTGAHSGYYLYPMLFKVSSQGVYKTTFIANTAATNRKGEINFRCITSSSNVGEFKFRILLLKNEDVIGNQDFAYFEDMESVRMPVLTTTGKNLNSANNEDVKSYAINDNGSIATGGGEVHCEKFIKVPPSSKIFLSFGENKYIKVLGYDKNKNLTRRIIRSDKSFSFQTNADEQYIRLSWNPKDTSDITKLSLSLSDYEYQPYKSNILTVNEEVTLRSNGDVYDELNLLTGRLTQRIDENNEVLSQEVVKSVDLNVVDQNNTKIDKIHVFDEVTHVNASSDELTPTVNIGKSVSYPTIIKPNTKYTVDLKRNDKPLTVNLGGTEVTFASGETRKTITTPSTLTNDKLSYYGVGAKCNEIMLIEGEIERNVDYFTGMQSVVMQNQMPILHTMGKNLFNGVYSDNYLQGGEETVFRPSNGDKKTRGFLVKCKPNTTYTVTRSFISNRFTIGGFPTPPKDNDYYVTYKVTENTFTTDGTNIYVYVYVSNEAEEPKVLFEESQVATLYEDYKTSILSCNDDVTLCGIGNVKDELNLMTGELIENLFNLDCSNTDFEISDISVDSTNTIRFMINNANIKSVSDSSRNNMCNKLPYNLMWRKDEEGYYVTNSSRIVVRLNKDKITSTVSRQVIKDYLSENNFKFIVEKSEKSIKTVDLNVVDQDGNTIPKIKSYKDVTHLEVTVPKQSLLPHISAEVATDNSKDMSSLTTKHQEISEAQSAIKGNIQSQSDEIDTALMTTTEIFERILE